jgi:hypothetical protein
MNMSMATASQQRSPTPLFGFFIVALLVLATVAILSPVVAGAQTQSQLTVTSENLSGGSLTGYYAVLSLGGIVVSNGFTPVAFSLTNGQTYVVQVDNYGSCNFDHWADTGSTSSSRPISITAATQVTAIYNCGGGGGSSSVTVNAVDQNGNPLSGFYVALLEGGIVTAAGFTTATFATTSGASYSVQADGYGNCTFTSWSDGVKTNPRSFTATSGTLPFTASYNCGGGGIIEGGAGPGTITVYDHRIAASYWAPCFAATCTNPTASCGASCTGPGAAMWVVLYDSAGNVAATGFSNENGLTFSGLNQSATYYLYPADCDLCHGSTHDVLFTYWGNNSTTTRPLAITANGAFVDAWYSCTNGCSGI